MGTIILSALVAHTGWHWMIDRAENLRRYRFQWPSLNAALLAGAMRWLMVIVIVSFLGWRVFEALRRLYTLAPHRVHDVGSETEPGSS